MRLKSQNGQMTVEAILILVIMVSVFTIVHRQIKKTNWVSQIVQGPWTYVAGMIEDGVWMPVQGASTYHPNVFGRRASPEPQ